MKIFVGILTFVLGITSGFAKNQYALDDLGTIIFVGCTDKSNSKMTDECLDEVYKKLLVVGRLRTELQNLSSVLVKTGQIDKSNKIKDILNQDKNTMSDCRYNNDRLKSTHKSLIGFESFEGQLTACFIMTEINLIRAAQELNL